MENPRATLPGGRPKLLDGPSGPAAEAGGSRSNRRRHPGGGHRGHTNGRPGGPGRRPAGRSGARPAGHQDAHALELPGYYRPEKKWDLLVVVEGQLITAIEFKSQVGPSFGNNYNNRVEEAIGNATDIKTAFREGRVGPSRPFLGYFFLLEDTPRVHTPVSPRCWPNVESCASRTGLCAREATA